MSAEPILASEAEYTAALREVSAFFDNQPEPNTAAGDRFDALLTQVSAYEAVHYPIVVDAAPGLEYLGQYEDGHEFQVDGVRYVFGSAFLEYILNHSDVGGLHKAAMDRYRAGQRMDEHNETDSGVAKVSA